MTNNPENRIQWIVDLVLLESLNWTETFGKYSEKFGMSDKTFDKDWKKANIAISERRSEVKKQKEEIYIQSELQAVKSNILQSLEKKEILSAIIRGETVVDDIIADKGEVIPYKRAANARERIEAIKVLNAMDGDNAPKEIKNSHEIKEMPSVQEWVLSKSNKTD